MLAAAVRKQCQRGVRRPSIGEAPDEGKRGRPHGPEAHRGDREISAPAAPMQNAFGLSVLQGVLSHSPFLEHAPISSFRGRRSSICWGVISAATPPPRTDRPTSSQDDQPSKPQPESCDVCGSQRLIWRNCKLICTNCRTILKSCADL